MNRAIGAALALCLLPSAASAQTGPAVALKNDQQSQGPMIVEQVHNGFLVAPDFKYTELDKKWSGLAGGYAGVVFDEHFFVGGAAYGLATNTHGREMVYGGLVLQWLGGGNDTFSFGAKTLLGGGRAELNGTTQILDRGRLITAPFRTRQDFFVAEPEVDAIVRIVSHVRLAVGAGYRFTGADRYDRYVFDAPGRMRLNGAVGSISLQIGGGS
ncbi:MAG TPA: hypothetical protein VGP77_12405 [Vicinamibacterales bacterium]|nr:hypothetical protein [Vicinamibacterales bacterium]